MDYSLPQTMAMDNTEDYTSRYHRILANFSTFHKVSALQCGVQGIN